MILALKKELNMSNKSSNPVAIITGGSRGVGAATAKLLASKGWNVAITCTSSIDDANSVIKECEGLGVEGLALSADVSDDKACRNTAEETIKKLLPNLKTLEKELKRKSIEFKKIVKIGRTHLQDATPLSLGQEFSGYHVQVKKSIERIQYALKEIFYLAQGGTAVGTGINSRKHFDKKIVKEIAKFTKIPFKPAENKFAELAAHDSIVNFSGTLNTCAVALMKISNDIRFLGSGPRAGYGELILPENEPGSSIMPGKVNPTQCEAVTMVCVKVIGNHNGITIAGSHGHFELNVFKPLIAHNILQSIDLIADSTKNFALYCVKGIKANKKKIQENLDNSLMLVTALAPKIGYDNAAKIAKTALKNNTTLKFETLKTGLINEKDYDKIVDPKKMIYPA